VSLLLALGLLVLTTVICARWPGWPDRLFRVADGPLFVVLAVVAAVALGLALDPLARIGLPHAVGETVAPALAPTLAAFGAWFRSPSFGRDLAVSLPALAAIIAEVVRPGFWRAGALRAVAHAWPANARRVAISVAILLPLAIGWLDVIATTVGQHGQHLYAAAQAAGVPLPGNLRAEPDPRLVAFAWWLAAGLLTLPALRTGGRRLLWAAVPLVGGVAGWLARDAAVALALPAYAAVAASTIAAALRARPAPGTATDGCTWRRAAPWVRRAALGAILVLALSLRWTPRMLTPPSSDAAGYFEAASAYFARLGPEETNPVALAYLSMHSVSREPLFMVLVSLAFQALGIALVHQRYVTVLASVGNVWLTYAFGRATLGIVAGLGAAFMLAIQPWHVIVSGEGLREETAFLAIWSLALLVWKRPSGGRGTALLAGILAAAACLIRIDCGAVVAFILVWWAWRLGPNWRRSLLAWAAFAVLVGPMLIANFARTGEPVTQLGGSMGGDIAASMNALERGEIPLPRVIAYFAAGTLEVYRSSMFGFLPSYLGDVLGNALSVVALACYAGGAVVLLYRGPRLPAFLSALGNFVPPMVFIAGIGVLGGPGGGYADRYAYATIPAVLAIAAWAGWRGSLLTVGRLHRRRGIEWDRGRNSASWQIEPARPAARP
jgi:hypothetical protein